MDEKNIIAYEGKSFSVTLQSMIYSTNYSWCLTNLPEGIVLFNVVNQPTRPGVAPVDQTFYFGVTSVPENPNIVLTFKLIFLSDFSKIGDTIDINVRLVPVNSNEAGPNSFVKYSENSAVYNAQIPYGFIMNDDPQLMYGYLCGANNNLKYGYPSCDDANVKYGYPCGVQSVLKYGFPCGSDTVVKYGTPCFDDPVNKYGYPCGVEYGYPSMLKYGYPNCQ